MRAFVILFLSFFLWSCATTEVVYENKSLPEISFEQNIIVSGKSLNDAGALKKVIFSNEEATLFNKRRAYWEKHKEGILSGLEKIIGLRFLEESITVKVLPYTNIVGFANPDVIVLLCPDDYQFTTILTHELTHRLLSFNKEGIDQLAIYQKMFPDLSNSLILYHLVLYAAMEELFVDDMKIPILFNIHKPSSESQSHFLAWEMVEKVGYKQILAAWRRNVHIAIEVKK